MTGISLRHALIGLAIAAVAGVVALIVVLATGDGGRESAHTDGIPAEIEAHASLSPRITLFGDTITARVEATVDRRLIDPDSVRVSESFAPWELAAKPERMQQEGQDETYLRTTFVLRCSTSPCVPARETAPLEFDPALVTYRRRGGQRELRTIDVRWPVLTVHTRIVSADFDRFRANGLPWRADVVSLPGVSYAADPELLFALLLVGGALLTVGGGALAYVAVPRRAPPPPPEPEAPEPRLTPLEQALALLESPTRTDGTADQRRALELVADALAARGAPELADTARTLAWSEATPALTQTRGLAARARPALGEEADARPA